MAYKQCLLLFLAATLSETTAFVVTGAEKSATQLRDAPFFVDIIEETPTESAVTTTETPPVLEKAEVKSKPSKPKAAPSNSHPEGIFTPAVKLGKFVLGEERLNKVRGKAINLHSQVITSLIQTSGSQFGQLTLKQLFKLADTDGNGTVDKEELRVALGRLGFQVPEKQLEGIFQRADKDGNGEIDFEEWSAAAPNTLKAQLIKMAKKNGGELGFLS